VHQNFLKTRQTLCQVGFLLILGFCVSGCCALQTNTTHKQLHMVDVNVYPSIIYKGIHRTACIDLGVLPKDIDITSFTVDISMFGTGYKELSSYVEDHSKRYCCCFDIPPDIAPGVYRLPLKACYNSGTELNFYVGLNVACRPISKEPDILSPANQSIIDSVSNSHLVPGNYVEALDDGEYAFDKWVEVLKSAEKQINLQSYYLDDSGRCAMLTDILQGKAEKGVDVNILITRYSQMGKSPLTYLGLKRHGINVILIGDIGFPKDSSPSRKWLEKMRQDYRIFQDIPKAPPFMEWMEEKGDANIKVDYALHEKMLIVDGRKAILGGRNLSDCYFYWWKDKDLYLEGPIVEKIQNGFMRNWKEFIVAANCLYLNQGDNKKGPCSKGDIRARFVQSKPWNGNYSTLDMLCSAIGMAGKSAYISSQYLALPPLLESALIGAARRGVDVRILTNSYDTGQEVMFSMCHFISLNYYRDLLEAGVRIFEYEGKQGPKDLRPYYHAKEFLIDGIWLSIGSFNLSIRSSYLESEVMVNIHDPKMASRQQDAFLKILAKEAREVTLEDFIHEEEAHSVLMNLAKHIEILY